MPRNSEAKFGNYSHSSVGLVQKDLCTAHCKQTNFFQKLQKVFLGTMYSYIFGWLVNPRDSSKREYTTASSQRTLTLKLI